MIKVGINGFGRIGSLAFRSAIKSDDIEVVAINAPGKTAGQLAYAVKYDTVHGKFNGTVAYDDEAKTLTVDGKTAKVLDSRDPSLLPWGELGVEYVLECTGKFLTKEAAQPHIDAGAKVVVMSGPAKDDTPMFVCGVNLDKYTPDMQFVSNASCTTNCLAPLAKVINDNFGIVEGLMTTVHAGTASQQVVDAFSKKNWRLGGENSGHVICLDYVSTGDGIVSALQVLKAAIRQQKSLEELTEGLTMLPQELINLRLSAGFDALSDERVHEEVKAVEAELGSHGRVLLRKSGTEPLVRVMVEGEDREQVHSLAVRLADVIRRQAEEV